MKPYLNNLTALRGIAAVLVVVLHFHFFLGAILPRDSTGLIDKLYLMVDMFFILSGFVMCYVYGDTFKEKVKYLNYKKFLIFRLARIYPIHVITLLAEVLICIIYLSFDKFDLLSNWRQHLYRWEGIFTNLAFLETVNIFNFSTWNMPAWSLSAEWYAYLVFPFIFILGIRNKAFALYGLPILVLGGWLLCEFYLHPLQPFLHYPKNPLDYSLDVNWHWGALRGIFGFMAGMFVFQLFQKEILKKFFGNGWVLFMISLIVLVWMHFKRVDTVTVILFALIILSSAYGSKNIDRFFSINIFQKLGDWSFSIYLWHMVFFNVITMYFVFQRDKPIKGIFRPFEGDMLKANILMVLCFGIIILIGYLSNRYIENPSREFIRKRISE